jgi:hypothetical protein
MLQKFATGEYKGFSIGGMPAITSSSLQEAAMMPKVIDGRGGPPVSRTRGCRGSRVSLKLRELSSVDNPAQPGARIARFMKRHEGR